MSVEVFKVTAEYKRCAGAAVSHCSFVTFHQGRVPPTCTSSSPGGIQSLHPVKDLFSEEKKVILSSESISDTFEKQVRYSQPWFLFFLLSCDGFKTSNEDIPLKRWWKISSVPNSGSKSCPWDSFVALNPFLHAVPKIDGAHGSACWSKSPCEDGQSTDRINWSTFSCGALSPALWLETFYNSIWFCCTCFTVLSSNNERGSLPRRASGSCRQNQWSTNSTL